MSSVARKFGMSHLLPNEATVIYPNGQHQHHVESDFSSHSQLYHPQQQQRNNNNNQQFSTHIHPEHQNYNYLPYQKQTQSKSETTSTRKLHQQQKKSLPASIKMETTSSDNCNSMPVLMNNRIGDHQIVANRNSNTSTLTGYNSVSSRRNNSDNSLHTIASGDNGVIGGGMDPGGGSAAAAVKKRSITSMVESFLDEHKDFLDNYVRRKVSKARLENWLYKPNTQTPNSRSSSPGLLYSSSYGDNNGPPNGTQDTTNNMKHHRASEPIQFWNNSMNSSSSRNSSYGRMSLMASTSNLPSILNQSIKNPNTLHLNVNNKMDEQHNSLPFHRERSQSTVVTPATRRMSAASFVGCQTPLLSTNNETGQLSFLRSTSRTTSYSNQTTSPPANQPLPTSYEKSNRLLTASPSVDVYIPSTSLKTSETTPTITINDRKSFLWPSGGLTNSETTKAFLKHLQRILTSENVEGFALNVNRAVKCIFSNRIEIAGTFVIQGDTGTKKAVDNAGFTGDLYLLDKDDQMMADNGTTATGISKTVMTTLQVVREQCVPFDHGNGRNQYNTMVGPLINHNKNRALGTIQVYNSCEDSPEDENDKGISKSGFSQDDEIVFCQLLEVISCALSSLQNQQEMRLELTRSQVFLELARLVFREQDHLEPTMVTILSNFLKLIDCARCQILLSDPSDPTVFKRVFDMTKEECASLDCDFTCENFETNDKNYNGQKRALPVNASIASEVARTNKKVNLRNLPLGGDDENSQNELKPSGNGSVLSGSLTSLEGDIPNSVQDDTIVSESSEGYSAATHYNSFLCMAIRDPDDKVLGVVSLIDKESGDGGSLLGQAPPSPSSTSGGGYFTENDEQFVRAFTLFCGMAIRNAAEYEKAVVSEAKYQVAFEVMNYQAAASETEVNNLAVDIYHNLPAASTYNIDTFEFNYLPLNDNDTLQATIRMFVDLGLLSAFNIEYDTLCRWLLTVKRNYRNETVQYHNWYHAFNVAQMMFCMLNKANWIDQKFKPAEILGMLVACICHDLDHRGTNNTFERKRNNPLAKLYSTSTLERHHLNHCLLLLNIKGNGILDNLSKDEYSQALQVIESCILATDLEQHFRHRDRITKFASGCSLSPRSQEQSSIQEEQFLLQSALMTAADLGAVTKPWAVHRHVSQLIAEEFWKQGDLERSEFHIEPPPVLDRHASLSAVQLGFIDNICRSHYEDMVKLNSDFSPMLEGCLANRSKWVEIEEGKEDKNDSK